MNLSDLKVPENAPKDLRVQISNALGLMECRSRQLSSCDRIKRCAVAALYWRKAEIDLRERYLVATSNDSVTAAPFAIEDAFNRYRNHPLTKQATNAQWQADLWHRAAFEEVDK